MTSLKMFRSRARVVRGNCDPLTPGVSDRRTPQPHMYPCVTVRCRRAEVRDASVGLNVSKALDVGARAAWCKVGDAEGR